MSDINLKTITQSGESVLSEKGSRFLAFSFPVDNKEKITERRKAVQLQHPDATHHCFAWHIDPFRPEEYAQDDGEPGGTAGLPILGVIKSEELINVLVIVVRYFGGTKLGKTGLIQSYRAAAVGCLAAAEKKPLGRYSEFKIEYPYELENRIQEILNRFGMIKQNEQYLATVTITVNCPSDYADELQNILEHLAYLGITSERKSDRYLAIT